MLRYLKYLPVFVMDIFRILRHKVWQASALKKNPQLSAGKSLRRFKDCEKGRRCFIVGNGPSVRASDLDLLKNEDCFAANGIWGIFDQTEWRPKYYCLGDPDYAKSIGENMRIPLSAAKECFFVFTHLDKYPSMVKTAPNANFMLQNIPNIYEIAFNKFFCKDIFKHSTNIVRNAPSCGTVTYHMLQIALYMGYSEIYLYGIDHNYSGPEHFESCDGCDLDIDDLYSEATDLSNWERGYRTAKHLAEKQNSTIYNATRGGKLEIFERVDFDQLMGQTTTN